MLWFRIFLSKNTKDIQTKTTNIFFFFTDTRELPRTVVSTSSENFESIHHVLTNTSQVFKIVTEPYSEKSCLALVDSILRSRVVDIESISNVYVYFTLKYILFWNLFSEKQNGGTLISLILIFK